MTIDPIRWREDDRLPRALRADLKQAIARSDSTFNAALGERLRVAIQAEDALAASAIAVGRKGVWWGLAATGSAVVVLGLSAARPHAATSQPGPSAAQPAVVVETSPPPTMPFAAVA